MGPFFWEYKMKTINLVNKYHKIKEQWLPKIIAQMNGQDIRLAKIEGEFLWHSHEETDELFFVHKGKMIMHYRHESVKIEKGEIHVVPKGVEHKPEAIGECEILMIEASGTLNTGSEGGERTAPTDDWI